ncbi:BREX system P-loop protein BrxC [Fictibacillus sp. WQ 8-8]|uniref:BREX system P-loop protein BrxC n=1 Tax=Fictibacillus sp. WQ 8-8 TaxID=2938788 RepID=UPI0021091751|nr:BREX system P-loop protein BrxC [Fictibacillus sp. WQ 8-8]MCQ6266318.1 BREX system P-loop protein BrxC [Fictibacillus sp. WQ 8-8]
MQIQKMFDKLITRDIKGVVKVGQDDEKNIYQELDEYVVTNELHKHIGDFFQSYKKGIRGNTDKVGVWISGFFGSGKSHFLKILSYLIENKIVNDKEAINFFDKKIHDSMILADLKMAGDITTDVILFDIDAKSESDSKSDKDSIVKVLNKVFNEMQGFCGSIPWIADIERKMDKDGLYEHFREAFNEISGNRWEDSREDFYYEEDSIIEALCKTTKMSEDAARHWFELAEQEYSISIEKFAKRVNEYIEDKRKQPDTKDHHVVFLVDEVGQYIGDNSQSMLNLQTIVHQFGIHCSGKAWIVVTSQEDIDSVLSVKGNDFSKIQGRFDTKLSLSSAYVDEVIKKRILIKNEAGTATLKEVYRQKSSILKNLFLFSHEAAEMKTFISVEDFVDIYPFVPYQFNLLQKVFTGVRIHGASGKSLSEGERSLLSAFQESAIRFAEHEEGSLVPFSAFYETIEAFLDSSIRTVIIHAKKNSRLKEQDIEILKLLFLIKYVKELPSDLENLSTLMVNHIDVDKIDLKKEMEASLTRLSRETLIQKNGDEYIFLTNDEQDVNREIKNMHVDTAEVIHKIGEEIFNTIYKDKKFRYSTRYHFGFNGIIDDRPITGQTNDFGIKIITPYYEETVDLNQSELKMMSMRENNVIIKLPIDTSYLDEMEHILKIQAYLKVKSGSSVSQTIEDIKTRKGREVTDRKERVTTYLTEAFKVAEVYVNSQLLDVKEKNPVDRINDAFRALIENLFSKLIYIKEYVDTTKQLDDLIKENTTQLTLTDDDEPNKLALQEVSNYIARLSSRKQQVTIKGITTYFSKQPYGWNELDTTAIIIKLFKCQEIKFELNQSNLSTSDRDILNYLTKRDYVDKVVIKKRERISQNLIKITKNIIKDMFGITAVPNDEDGLMVRCKELLQKELNEINLLLVNYRNKVYPRKDILTGGKNSIGDLLSISDTASFYEQIKQVEDDLLDYAEAVANVKDFFENQRELYDNAVKRLNIFESNRSYVTDNKVLEIIAEMEKIVKHSDPFDNIQKLPGLYKDFDDLFVLLLEKECEPISKAIDQDLMTVMGELSKDSSIKEKFSEVFRNRFSDLKSRLERVNNFYEAIAMQTESDRLKVRCIDEINSEVARRNKPITPPSPSTVGTGVTTIVDPPSGYKETKTISKSTVLRGTKTIENEDDIESLLNELRQELKKELKENMIIKLV